MVINMYNYIIKLSCTINEHGMHIRFKSFTRIEEKIDNIRILSAYIDSIK